MFRIKMFMVWVLLVSVCLLAGCGKEKLAGSAAFGSFIASDADVQVENSMDQDQMTEAMDQDQVAETEDYSISDIPEEKMTACYNIGDIVTFGNYGGSAIEWIVLDSDDKKALLWSRYCLDSQQYNNVAYDDVSWKTCMLRQWINLDFMNEAFGMEEQSHIIRSKLENMDCEETEDSIFILSAKELSEYVSSTDWLIGYPTEYAVSQGIHVNTGMFDETSKGKSIYWIRGNFSGEPSTDGDWIDANGEIRYGMNTDDELGVRPAVWYSYDSMETSQSVDSDYIAEGSSERYLSKEELEKLSQEKLRLARNEIYAKHGYQFESKELKEYFGAKSWYYPKLKGEDFLECFLNLYEKYNIQLIQALENDTEYTVKYEYEEIDEDVADEFSGNMDVGSFEDLCGEWESYDDTITITKEEFDGHPYHLLKFERDIGKVYYGNVYQIVFEVYYEDDIKIVSLITDTDVIEGGFHLSYYDRYGDELTQDGYEVDSIHFTRHIDD